MKGLDIHRRWNSSMCLSPDVLMYPPWNQRGESLIFVENTRVDSPQNWAQPLYTMMGQRPPTSVCREFVFF